MSRKVISNLITVLLFEICLHLYGCIHLVELKEKKGLPTAMLSGPWALCEGKVRAEQLWFLPGSWRMPWDSGIGYQVLWHNFYMGAGEEGG